ncbi:9500_t:CDS:2 [Gigaspora margarita]|uniref:9500_t:CDS:1 n=1 Tax=Gigaspora margarita TaxID=4874 RepID=A0ABN7WY06_GIGMA|nr:9500_t:CDS:2 [Gigaspora margarita]
MGRIRKNEIPLSEDDYKKYCQKLPNSLKQAAWCYTNGLESKMVKKVKGKLIAELKYQPSNYLESTDYIQALVNQTPEKYISNSNQMVNQTLNEYYPDQTPN